MGSGVPTGPRGETHRDHGSSVLTPRVPSVPRHACWIILAHLSVLSEPTFTLYVKQKSSNFPD